MKSKQPTGPVLERNQKSFRKFLIRFRKNWQLHLLIALPIIHILIFHYIPMYGLQIAFREYKPREGIWGSPWVGLKHIKTFLSAYNFTTILTNTLVLSLYRILVGFPIPIILALMLHINEHPKLKKLTQNVAYMPHFISTVVLVGILNQVLNPVSGLVGTIYHATGGIGVAPDIRAEPGTFRHLYVWSGIWQSMGWSTIVYVAALAGVSSELHEAAELDGANRLKRVFNVDLPAILPTICILLIMRFGHVMAIGHEKALLMQNDLNLSKSEVIATYVYKTGLGKMRLSFGSAVGLFNSLINTILLIIVNSITRWLSSGENSLF